MRIAHRCRQSWVCDLGAFTVDLSPHDLCLQYGYAYGYSFYGAGPFAFRRVAGARAGR